MSSTDSFDEQKRLNILGDYSDEESTSESDNPVNLRKAHFISDFSDETLPRFQSTEISEAEVIFFIKKSCDDHEFQFISSMGIPIYAMTPGSMYKKLEKDKSWTRLAKIAFKTNRRRVRFAHFTPVENRNDRTVFDEPIMREPKEARRTRKFKKVKGFNIDEDVEFGDGLTLEELIEYVEDEDDPFVANFMESLRDLYETKLEVYADKVGQLNEEMKREDRKIENLKSMGVSSSDIAELFPLRKKRAIQTYDITELINFIRKRKKCFHMDGVREGLRMALMDGERGLSSLVGRDDIKRMVIDQLVSFSKSYKTMFKNFNNIALLGPAGVGKTMCAKILGYVYSEAGILVRGDVKIVSRTDLVAGYIGQTAPRTNALLMQTLESIIFIDEAYQLAPSRSDSKDFGSEAITEIVNFLDKWLGLSVMIVAGYHDVMMERFFTSNEGLDRRFPHKITLDPYDIGELSNILIDKIEDTIDAKITKSDCDLIYTMLTKYDKMYPLAFKNHAGDMMKMANIIAVTMHSSVDYEWGEDSGILLRMAFERYIHSA